MSTKEMLTISSFTVSVVINQYQDLTKEVFVSNFIVNILKCINFFIPLLYEMSYCITLLMPLCDLFSFSL